MLRVSEHAPHDCPGHRAQGPDVPVRHRASSRAPRAGHPRMPGGQTHGAACKAGLCGGSQLAGRRGGKQREPAEGADDEAAFFVLKAKGRLSASGRV